MAASFLNHLDRNKGPLAAPQEKRSGGDFLDSMQIPAFGGSGGRSGVSKTAGPAAREDSNDFFGRMAGTGAAANTGSNSRSTCSSFIDSFSATSASTAAAGSDTSQRTKLAREAYARIRRFMERNSVTFNGAGDQGLGGIEQAWSVSHLDAATRRANEDTLKGVAGILLDYPTLRCTVHGETGAANRAPQALASHLGVDATRDVKRCMDFLAQQRAQSCLDVLVGAGVERQQLTVSYDGMGGDVKVDFIPEGAILPEHQPQPVPTPMSSVAPAPCPRCPQHEDDKRRLQAEVEALRQKLTLAVAKGGSDAADEQRRRADALQTEVEQLRAQLTRCVDALNAERAEGERRARDESHRYASLQYEFDQERREASRLLDENRRLKAQELAHSAPSGTSAPTSGTLELLDLLPAGLELGSLKRSEWRHIFERLVAELVRRKKSVSRTTMQPSFDFRTDHVLTEVDQLWDDVRRNRRSSSSMPMPTPYAALQTQRRSTADDFLRSLPPQPAGSNKAEDFLAYAGGAPKPQSTQSADAFLAFGESKASRPMTATSANDFIAFTSSPGGSRTGAALPSVGGGGGPGGLASDADAFLGFMGKRDKLY